MQVVQQTNPISIFPCFFQSRVIVSNYHPPREFGFRRRGYRTHTWALPVKATGGSKCKDPLRNLYARNRGARPHATPNKNAPRINRAFLFFGGGDPCLRPGRARRSCISQLAVCATAPASAGTSSWLVRREPSRGLRPTRKPRLDPRCARRLPPQTRARRRAPSLGFETQSTGAAIRRAPSCKGGDGTSRCAGPGRVANLARRRANFSQRAKFSRWRANLGRRAGEERAQMPTGFHRRWTAAALPPPRRLSRSAHDPWQPVVRARQLGSVHRCFDRE